MDAVSFTFILFCFAGCLNYGSSSNVVPKIIGGRPVTIQQAPYMVLMIVNQDYSCGGSILNSWWIVTAAHCFLDIRETVRSVRICSGSSSYRTCTPHEVSNFIIHPQYNEFVPYNNDIALVKLTNPVTFNRVRQPITLPSAGAPNVPSGTICGWGRYRKYPNGTAVKVSSDQLRCAQVSLVNECQRYLHSVITPQMVCYGYLRGGIGTCQGDSGGPLMNGRTLYGITSWGIGCADAGLPGVFTKVSKFVGWIKWITGIN